MSGTLLADAALAARLEAADAQGNVGYVRAKQRLYPESQSAWLAIGDGYAVFTGPASPINRVHGLGMSRAITAPEIDAADGFYRRRGLSPAIDLCPLAHPTLVELLRARRYSVTLFKHVWALPLHGGAILPAVNPAISVAAVAPEQRDLWAAVVASSFSGGAIGAADVEIPLPTAHKEDTTCFLAWLEGKVAGGGALSRHDGVATCFSTAVRPELRRLGVQSALLHARLAWARVHDCDLVMVQTTPGSASQRNVARFGFRLAYTKATVVSDG
jgi:GNAT superfamily N-acetyltransferase